MPISTLSLLTIFFASVTSIPNNLKNIQLENSLNFDELFFDNEYSLQNNGVANRRTRAADLEPEATMTVEEIIKYHGYPVENHEITTEDGYIITIQRIPHGINGTGSEQRKPVLLQHGLFCSAAAWVTNNKNQNLAYILADAGYDVWLGNFRGVTNYGRKHVSLSPNDKKFWLYSFDEIGRYDIPAFIDKILEVTGHKQILYIGHSMGVTTPFVLLSTKPEYNKKIKGLIAMAPAIYVGDLRGPMKYLTSFTKQFNFMINLFGNGELFANSNFFKVMASTVCVSPVRIICSSIIFIISGFNLEQLNMTRLPVIVNHVPAGTSTHNMFHFSQLVGTGRFQHLDLGPVENEKKYGQINAPQYNVSKITAPVAIFFGDNDLAVDSTGVSKLAQTLPNLVYKYRVPDEKFSHTDFMWAIDGKKLVYNKVIEIMKRMWK